MNPAPHRHSWWKLTALCAALAAMPCRAQSPPTAAASTARQAMAHLTTRQKIAQLVVPWMPGTYAAADDPALQRIARWVDSLGVGGLIVSVGSPLDVAARLNALQRHARIPLLIASDLEGGTWLRLTGGTPFPGNMGVAATGRDGDAYAMGRITALEGRAVGIHLVLAPVADLNSNPANPIINTRSFGADPVAVSALVAAEVRGIQDHGMFATAKHFPGHGDVEIDSHLALPRLDVPWTRLDTLELVPFRGAIAAGVAAVMSAHVAIAAFEPGAPTPATLVPAMLTGVLRDSLRFQGLVVTDALNMAGIVSTYGGGEAAVLAFLAGADVLLQPADPAVVVDAMEAALKAGRYTPARLDRSVRRVLELKEKAGLFRRRTVPLENVTRVVGRADFRDTARSIAARGIVLLRDRGGVLDSMRARRGHRSLIAYGDESSPTAGIVLAAELRARGDSITLFRLTPASGPASYDSARAAIAGAPGTIFAVAIRAFAGRGTITMPAPLTRLIDSTAAAFPTVLVSLGSPYTATQASGVGTCLLAWASNSTTEWAAAAALTGAAIGGRMPVPMPPDVPLGAGLSRPAIPVSLRTPPR